jgi:uncharacterized membrane protein YccC
LVAFALTIFVLGLISIAFRLEKVGYSYAGMTLAIIVLIPRPEVPWIAAVHRFTEVSLGILVALAVVTVWREEQRLFSDAKPNNEMLRRLTCRLGRMPHSALGVVVVIASSLSPKAYTSLSTDGVSRK